MTATTKALKDDAKGKGRKVPAGSGAADGMLVTLALSAITSGLAGVALNKGFGVSVPFAAGFFLIVASAFFLCLATLVVATSWQSAAVAAAPKLAAGIVAGTFAAETAIKEHLGTEALKDFDRHAAEAFGKDNGGYM